MNGESYPQTLLEARIFVDMIDKVLPGLRETGLILSDESVGVVILAGGEEGLVEASCIRMNGKPELPPDEMAEIWERMIAKPNIPEAMNGLQNKKAVYDDPKKKEA